MGRRRQENALSLFAFQDIITGVAGVMLFILLLLVVQLAVPAAQKMKDQDSDKPEIAFPVAAAADLAELDTLRERLETLRSQTSKFMQAQQMRPDVSVDEIQQQLKTAYEKQQDILAMIDEINKDLRSKETRQQSAQTTAAIEDIEQELAEISKELEKWSGGDFIAFQAGTSIPNLWLVDLRGQSAEFVHLKDPKQSKTVRWTNTRTPVETVQWLEDQLATRNAGKSIVLLIRPSAAGVASEVMYRLQRSGYRIALEILDSETRIVNTQPPNQPTDAKGRQ